MNSVAVLWSRHRAAWRCLLVAGVASLLSACVGELNNLTPTPTPPADPHNQYGDETLYWDDLATGEQVHHFYAVAGDGVAPLYLAGDGGAIWEWKTEGLTLLTTLTTEDGESPDIHGLALHSDFLGKLLVGAGDRGTLFFYEFSTAGFELLPTQTLSAFKAVKVFDRTNMWAVGDGGVYRFDGESWMRDTTLPGSVQLDAVWGMSSDDLYVAGDAGTLFHRGPEGWTRINLGRGENLYALWGSSPQSVFVAGQDGLIMHFDGVDWSVQETGSFDHLWSLTGLSDSSVFAAGTNGTTLFCNGVGEGQGWQRLAAETGQNLYGLYAADATHVYAAGARGALLRFDNDPTPPPLEE